MTQHGAGTWERIQGNYYVGPTLKKFPAPVGRQNYHTEVKGHPEESQQVWGSLLCIPMQYAPHLILTKSLRMDTLRIAFYREETGSGSTSNLAWVTTW